MKSSLLYSKGLNGKKLIQNKYLWNNIIEEQIKSYESILGDRMDKLKLVKLIINYKQIMN